MKIGEIVRRLEGRAGGAALRSVVEENALTRPTRFSPLPRRKTNLRQFQCERMRLPLAERERRRAADQRLQGIVAVGRERRHGGA